MTNDDAQLLSIAEVAMMLGVSAPSIRRKIAAGELTAVQLGGRKSAIRIPRASIENYLVSHIVEAA